MKGRNKRRIKVKKSKVKNDDEYRGEEYNK